MNLTLRHLTAFLVVAELGSFTRAAERLHIAQPALSNLIRDLEGRLGARLLDRTTRRTELTEAGREFRSSISKVMEDLDHAVRGIKDLSDRRRGRVVIAAPPLLAATLLPGAIAEFRRNYPGITFGIIDTRTDLIVERVRRGEADCGVGTFVPHEEGILQTSIARDHLMLFYGPGFEIAQRPSMSWRDLNGLPLIALTRDSGIRLLVEMGYESASLAARPIFEVEQITTALALVQANFGVAVLPTYARALPGFQDVGFKRLFKPTMTREISVIRLAGRSMSPAVEAFLRLLQKYAQLTVPNDGKAPNLARGNMQRARPSKRHGIR